MTAGGSFAGFSEVAASSLAAETQLGLTEQQVAHAVEGFGELTAQPDAVTAIRAAVDAGLRVFTLSNGAATSARAFLERVGVSELVEQVLSIDQVQAWKPVPASYELAVRCAGVPAERVALVAVHSCDIHGAHQAGLTTGWSPRLEGVPTPVFSVADVVADTLDGAITGLAALPSDDNDG